MEGSIKINNSALVEGNRIDYMADTNYIKYKLMSPIQRSVKLQRFIDCIKRII